MYIDIGFKLDVFLTKAFSAAFNSSFFGLKSPCWPRHSPFFFVPGANNTRDEMFGYAFWRLDGIFSWPIDVPTYDIIHVTAFANMTYDLIDSSIFWCGRIVVFRT